MDDDDLFCTECGTKADETINISDISYDDEQLAPEKDKKNFEQVSEEILNNMKTGAKVVGGKAQTCISEVKKRPNTVKFLAIIVVVAILVIFGGIKLTGIVFGSGPERTVEKFMDDIQDGDFVKAFNYTDLDEDKFFEMTGVTFNDIEDEYGSEMKGIINEYFNVLDFEVKDIKEITNNGKIAKVKIEAEYIYGNDIETESNVLTLKKIDGKWKIIIADQIGNYYY